MASWINPPILKKSKTYERYKQELLAWKEITELRQDKQGIAIALSLPDGDEYQIREKVFDQIPLTELKSLEGFSVLIKFLDQHLAKDDLTDSLEKFEDFEDFCRSDGQSITDYVAAFDAKYRKIEKKNMKLPAEILAFKLLRKAKVTQEEKLLVLTGMNYENKGTLYEEAKRSLKKFKGNNMSLSSGSASIKLEPAFLAANEEALLAAGYSRSRGYHYHGNTRRGRKRDRSSGESCEGNGSEDDRGTEATLNEGALWGRSDIGIGNTSRAQKKINRKGSDGRTLLCNSCGSYRHLLVACPDSWENMAKVNVVDEEHLVLFTGCNSKKVKHIGSDYQQYKHLGSDHSRAVCGNRWVNSSINSFGSKDKVKVRRSDSQESFALKESGRKEEEAYWNYGQLNHFEEQNQRTEGPESRPDSIF